MPAKFSINDFDKRMEEIRKRRGGRTSGVESLRDSIKRRLPKRGNRI